MQENWRPIFHESNQTVSDSELINRQIFNIFVDEIFQYYSANVKNRFSAILFDSVLIVYVLMRNGIR